MNLYFKDKLKEYKLIEAVLFQELLNIRDRVIYNLIEKFTKKHHKRNRLLPKSVDKTIHKQDKSIDELNDASKSNRYIDKKEKLQLLKKLQKEKEIRHAKIKAEQEARNKIFIEEFQAQQTEEKISKDKQKEEKILKLKEMHNINYHKKHERLENFEKSKEELKKVSSVKPLFKELEERYTTHIELPELEKKKQELVKRRHFFAPIDTKQIMIHNKNYKILLEELEHKRQQKLRDIKNNEMINSSMKNLYKSKIFDIAQQSEKEKADLISEKEQYKKKLVEKSKKYGELINELYIPVKKIDNTIEKSSSQQKLMSAGIQIEKTIKLQRKKIKINQEMPSVTSRTHTTKNTIHNKRKTSNDTQKKDNSFDYLAVKRKIRADKSADVPQSKKN